MDFSQGVLGQSTVKTLQARISTPLLVIGTDQFTRHDLAHVDCFNFIAAATLNRILADIGIKNTRDLYQNYPPSVLAVPRIGTIALAVLGAAFEAKGVGGDTPLDNWVKRHHPTGIQSFITIKHQQHRDAAQEKKDKKRRKADRKDRAHRIRLQRFTERAADEETTV